MTHSFLLRAEAHEVALQHVAWCFTQEWSANRMMAAVGAPPGRYTLREVAAHYARLWLEMRRDPE